MEKSKIENYRKVLFEAQRIAVIQESPDDEPTEEYIESKCAELKNKIIDAESINNRFRNPKLHAIWNSPPRFRKI